MIDLVNQIFCGLVVIAAALKFASSKITHEEDSKKNESDHNENKDTNHATKIAEDKKKYRKLKLQYFPAYFAAIFGDWLQGPYVYKLYFEYGFQENHIAILFLTGFGSSFTFGTFTGPLADKFGRKSMTQVFCLLYSLSCVIKFSSNFWILICGRILAGISTSLLFRCLYIYDAYYTDLIKLYITTNQKLNNRSRCVLFANLKYMFVHFLLLVYLNLGIFVSIEMWRVCQQIG